MDDILMSELNDEELLLLSQFDRSRPTDEKVYEKAFSLDDFGEMESIRHFRFEKQHIGLLVQQLDIPDTIHARNGTVVGGLEGLCVLLRRMAYPCRLGDLCRVFERPLCEISYICTHMLDLIYDRHNHLLQDLNQAWLRPQQLRMFADAISAAGAPMPNCWGFIDGTLRPICRPLYDQRHVFNGQKRTHGLKFQSVVTPDGMVANLYGPVEGRRHDSGMLRESGLLNQLEQRMTLNDGTIFSLYGDPAYPVRAHLIAPFRNAVLTPQQRQFNQAMSGVRVAVEWAFSKILNNFAFLDYKKNQKLYLQPVGKYYAVATILSNCQTCLYGNETGQKFNVEAPSIQEYLHG